MEHQDRITLTPCYTPSEELGLPLSTYVLSGGSRLIIIDPGPDSHLRNHMGSIAERLKEMEGRAGSKVPIAAIVLSPGPTAFDGLPLLAGLSRKRTVVLHWHAAVRAASSLDGWRVQTLTTRGAGMALLPTAKLTLGLSPSAGPQGSLMALESGEGTLFSGPFYGSIGAGQRTDKPVLRRESVRAYRDLISPDLPDDLVRVVFGRNPSINQIAPAHGRLAVGGEALIRTVTEETATGGAVQHSIYRMFVRIAALLGVETAAGIFRATGVPLPELETGYLSLGSRDVAGLTGDHWTKLLEAVEQWVPGSALTLVFPLAAVLARAHDLPLTDGIDRYRRANMLGVTVKPEQETRSQSAPAARETVLQTDAPGGPVEMTDAVTGLMNETVFKQRLAGQVRSLSASKGTGSLILIGVDDVPRINSTFGRSAGDHALYTVAYLLRNFQAAHSRKGAHRLYKLGGPHFAYVLSSESLAEAAELAEQIRRTVSESAMFVTQLTVSIGVVGLGEIVRDPRGGSNADAGGPETGTDPDGSIFADELTSRAFGRLRIARTGGANNVCSAEPEAAVGLSYGTNVLIADPDAPYLELLTQQLKDNGFGVLLARDGAEAQEIIEQIVPDAIVSEVMLPKINGFVLRERLRHNTALNKIPFILVSHRKSDETIERAATLGIVHFFAKPFSMVELIGLLGNLTRNATESDAGGGAQK